jgi:hypothetical protein
MSADVVWLGAPDQVEGGPRRAPVNRWVVRTVVALVVIAVAAALVLPWLDRRQRSQELAALTGCVATGQSAVDYANASLRGMTQYISAGLGSAIDTDVRRSMFGLLSQAASAGVPALDAAVRSCTSVSVKPSHHQVVDAKAAYVRWLAAKDAFFRAIVKDPRVARSTPPAHAELFDDARRALLAASTDAGRLQALRSVLAP